ncbi:hypothetical protein CN404_10760 [Bacillus thuringiensis]|uniref:C39 family peptidase n=1 Tax=Bacillus thuringiensis TaxID=1428 RepID=UPI000BF32AD5|nr:C39 family peptidase [Bacillus thuringiensis]PFB54238.1 hypothetical protein CN404_10760 [Bacillus thuringiensis]
MKGIRKLKWYICTALLGTAIWSVYTNGIPKYVEKLTFSNIQRGKETEFSNNDEKVILSNVPLIQQLPELDRGCEVTSLAMMLQYAGVRGNPNEGFVGNIYTFSESGYGVYHGPLFQLAEKYLPNKAVDLTGKNIEEIYKRVKAGQPVVMITNATFAPLDADEFTTWETNSGDVSITYNEHCVVLIGYDKEFVYIRDPLNESLDVKIPRESFEKAWMQMGSQAISYVKSSK